MTYKIHEHHMLGTIQGGTFKVDSLDAMREGLVDLFGPFPILFYGPAAPIDPTSLTTPPEPVPGIVLTAVVDIPGAAERGGPFLGAQMMGYVPAAKGPGSTGTVIMGIGVLKTPAWFTHTEPTVVEKPFDPEAPKA